MGGKKSRLRFVVFLFLFLFFIYDVFFLVRLVIIDSFLPFLLFPVYLFFLRLYGKRMRYNMCGTDISVFALFHTSEDNVTLGRLMLKLGKKSRNNTLLRSLLSGFCDNIVVLVYYGIGGRSRIII